MDLCGECEDLTFFFFFAYTVMSTSAYVAYQYYKPMLKFSPEVE